MLLPRFCVGAVRIHSHHLRDMPAAMLYFHCQDFGTKQPFMEEGKPVILNGHNTSIVSRKGEGNIVLLDLNKYTFTQLTGFGSMSCPTSE